MTAHERSMAFAYVGNGSNLAMLEIVRERLDGLAERLKRANVGMGKVNEGK